MKDITKHIIAKELFFFFKWMIKGVILSFIIWIIMAHLQKPVFSFATFCYKKSL